ncbi:hypothetical protein [Streptomyces sp. NPDC059491]|uniref:hypothetical protein n=1 Tax=Streptomyces sp. NPDC059491 TaxID=3346850 RepID=UPI00368EB010
MAPAPRTGPTGPHPHKTALKTAAVTALVVTAAGIGYLAAQAHPTTNDKTTIEVATKPSPQPHPEVTRTAGLSKVKTDTPGTPVKIRPCPGPNPYGTNDCPESAVSYLDDGASVQMWCWTDSYAPEGYPPTHMRWFYVIQADGSPEPGEEGYIYSALIPVTEQIRTPVCTTQRLLDLHPLPPAPPDPTPEPTPSTTPGPIPTASDTATAAPPPTNSTPALPPTTPAPPPPTRTRTSEPPPPPSKPAVREQSGSHGSPTFENPHGARGPGTRIPPNTWVDVECRVYAPEIDSANPDGWWYRIATSPWKGYYAVANTFMNGDAPGQQPPTNTDWSVPVC